jgi:SAM-dependent methyltransferase
MPPPSYVTVTELPGAGATREQFAMLYTRYHFAAALSRGRDVLEVACGAGLGLGYLSRYARTVVGGDYDPDLLNRGRTSYGRRIRLVRFDAHALPFAEASFDLVILFEALYYLAAPEQFVREAHRVLRPRGLIAICTANRDRPGFNPSPFASRYYSAPELYRLLSTSGFAAQIYGGFPDDAQTLAGRVLHVARKVAVGLHLIPPTMKGKEVLKRLVHGRLLEIPREVTQGMAQPADLVPLDDGTPARPFKVLYAMGRVA